MRRMAMFTLLLTIGGSLGGCVVLSAGGAVIGAGATVVSTTVKTTGAVVGAAARTVSGSNDKSDKPDSR